MGTSQAATLSLQQRKYNSHQEYTLTHPHCISMCCFEWNILTINRYIALKLGTFTFNNSLITSAVLCVVVNDSMLINQLAFTGKKTTVPNRELLAGLYTHWLDLQSVCLWRRGGWESTSPCTTEDQSVQVRAVSWLVLSFKRQRLSFLTETQDRLRDTGTVTENHKDSDTQGHHERQKLS